MVKRKMKVLFGKDVANNKLVEIKSKAKKFKEENGRAVSLSVVIVGDNPASQSYVRSKEKACDEVNFRRISYRLPSDTSSKELLDLIEVLNNDKTVDGILVQLPLPRHINEKEIIKNISPNKDVDGLTPVNMGKLLLGINGIAPCTPSGILDILDYYNIETSGKNVVVIGRSNIVGKPLGVLLGKKGKDATVTICNSKTNDLTSYTKKADILISAIGKPEFITSSMIKKNTVIIDVGINRVEDKKYKKGYHLVGDVNYSDCEKVASAITPVPGGVGLMTVAKLIENTLFCAEKSIDFNLG